MAKSDSQPSVLEGLDDPTQDGLDEIRAAAEVEAKASPENEYGRPGQPFDRKSPFFVGFVATLGVACALALAYIVVAASEVLVLLGLAFFLAVGLDPAVRWLYRRGLPRWAAVTLVIVAALAVFAGFVALAVPVLSTQATHLANAIPHYLRQLNHKNTELGKLNAKYHIVSALQKVLRGGGASFGTVVGVGKVVLDLVASVVVVVIVSIYLLADLPRVRRGIYLLAPRSRRARMVLLTDEIL